MAHTTYLHIGLPKSGTTFLQTRMWHNRAHLRDQGMLYPGVRRIDHFHGTRVARGLAADGSESAQVWRGLIDELQSWNGAALVSHEFFCMADAHQAADVLRDLGNTKVQVVITARDYARQLPATWQEALKMGTTGSFDDYMARTLSGAPRGGPWGWDNQDVVRIIERWSTALRLHGAPRPILVTVPPSGGDPGVLWRRWRRAVPFDDETFDPDQGRPNASLGAAQAALLLRVVPHLQPPFDDATERHRWIRGHLGHAVLVPQGGERIGLRPEQRVRLHEASRRAVDELDHMDVTVIGDLTDLQSPLEPKSGERPPDDVSDGELVQVAARALEQMTREVRELTIERNNWRRTALEAAERPPGWRERVRGVARRSARAQAPKDEGDRHG